MRRNKHSAVLHHLTSCLIAAGSKPICVGEANIPTGSSGDWGQLVEYSLDGGNQLALTWFQSGTATATSRWLWRWLSISDAHVRSARVFYQAELSIPQSGDRSKDVALLKTLAAKVFEELRKI